MFKLGTPTEVTGHLTRSSLGQFAKIGDLYDVTTDRFIGQSVITSSTQPLAVNSTPMESYREELLMLLLMINLLCLLTIKNCS